ncbi:MAG TPA: DNA repair protein RecN [Dehalococcoidia bacterium]|nr:DNA repair protein RecN [Dehalococcoidia bacterium]
MLLELTIRNYAIIDRLSIQFGPGLNVLTGETGAGKSIIVDALSTILGARTRAELVRPGTDQAIVEGVFELTGSPAAAAIQALLEDQGLAAEDLVLVITREINSSGRSIARVNRRVVPQAVLQQLGNLLVDIHGQHENLSLLRTGEQLDLLDRAGGLLDRRAEVAQACGEWRATCQAITTLQEDEREVARQLDLLRFQIEEIEAAALTPDEEATLEAEARRLSNAEALGRLAETVYEALRGGGRGQAAGDLIDEAVGALTHLQRLDPAVEPQLTELIDLAERVQDLARWVRGYRDELEADPIRLTQIEERRQLIQGLKRKYGGTIEEILAFAAQAAEELDRITHRDEELARLRERELEQRVALGRLAAALSQDRRGAADRLARAVERELADLNLARTRIHVDLQQTASAEGVPIDPAAPDRRYAVDRTGVDRVEFQISTNPGQPLRSLARVASGGEMSRIMLALKTVLSRVDLVPTLVFDEVDTGVGGRSGLPLGRKLAGIGRDHQVLCITHLPQIACYAAQHLRITKVVRGGHTSTAVEPLEPEDRVQELAEMLGKATPAALASARELLRQAAESTSVT